MAFACGAVWRKLRHCSCVAFETHHGNTAVSQRLRNSVVLSHEITKIFHRIFFYNLTNYFRVIVQVIWAKLTWRATASLGAPNSDNHCDFDFKFYFKIDLYLRIIILVIDLTVNGLL